MNSLVKLSIVAALSLFLSACGSGGGSTQSLSDKPAKTTKPTTPTTTQNVPDSEYFKPQAKSITGKIVDGYIKNATIFFDKNYNFIKDDGEISTTSDEFGRFRFSNLTQEAFGMTDMLVVENGTDIDTNKPNTQKLAYSLRNLVVEDIKDKPLYVTPLSSVFTHMAIAIVNGKQKELGITDFSPKTFEILGITPQDLLKDPKSDASLYKKALAIHKSFDITNSSYQEIVTKFKSTSTSFKDVLQNSDLVNKQNAVQLITYLDSISSLDPSKPNLAIKIDNAINDGSYNFEDASDKLKQNQNSNLNTGKDDNQNTDSSNNKPQNDSSTTSDKIVLPNDVDDFQDDAGNGIYTGRVILNGYVKGATVFSDDNRNGKLDNNEPSALTDEYGRFTLKTKQPIIINFKNQLAATGGIDMITQEPLTHTLAITPSLGGVNLPAYITPATTITATLTTLVYDKKVTLIPNAAPEAQIADAGIKSLDIMGIHRPNIQKNPIKTGDSLYYKVIFKINALMNITGASYADFTKALVGKNIDKGVEGSSLKNKEEAMKLIKFLNNIPDNTFYNHKDELAKKIAKQIQDKTYNFVY